MIALLKCYKTYISPVLGDNCRFYPSCSTYSIEALELHGITKGAYLTIRRLLKCHPFHEGGVDPVPEKIIKNKK